MSPIGDVVQSSRLYIISSGGSGISERDFHFAEMLAPKIILQHLQRNTEPQILSQHFLIFNKAVQTSTASGLVHRVPLIELFSPTMVLAGSLVRPCTPQVKFPSDKRSTTNLTPTPGISALSGTLQIIPFRKKLACSITVSSEVSVHRRRIRLPETCLLNVRS